MFYLPYYYVVIHEMMRVHALVRLHSTLKFSIFFFHFHKLVCHLCVSISGGIVWDMTHSLNGFTNNERHNDLTKIIIDHKMLLYCGKSIFLLLVKCVVSSGSVNIG